MNHRLVFWLFSFNALLTGCASVAVSDDMIVQRTAIALSLDKGTLTVKNRVNDGVRTDYDVTTKAGKTYHCYVTGTVTMLGRSVSDAMCNGTGKTPNPSVGNCNALLKAAGRCS